MLNDWVFLRASHSARTYTASLGVDMLIEEATENCNTTINTPHTRALLRTEQNSRAPYDDERGDCVKSSNQEKPGFLELTRHHDQ